MHKLICTLFLPLLGCGATPEAPTTTSAPVADRPEATATAPASDVLAGGDFLPPMPVAVTSFGATRDETHLYVLGGYHGEPHRYDREHQSGLLSRLALDGTGEWERLDTLEAGLQGVALVRGEGAVCRFGGNRIENAVGEPAVMRSVDEAACFELSSGRWTALPSLPEGRSSHEAARIGDTVFLAGGWRLDGDAASGAFAHDVLALDLTAPTAWRRIEAPFTRRALAVAAAGRRLVVLGGLTEAGEVSPRVDVLDPATETWSRGPDFPGEIDGAAFGLAATGVGDAVYASGREGTVHRWRVGEPSWTPVARLAFGRFFHQLVARETEDAAPELVAVGGIGGMHTEGRTRVVEVVPTAPTGPRLSTLVVPSPAEAKNRQGFLLLDDTLYLFGGNDSLGQHDFEPENFVSEGWQLHLPSLTWREGPAYPARRQTMQTLSTDSGGLSVGGFGHDGDDAVSFADAYAFRDGRWTERAGLPRDRTQFGLVEHDGQLFVFGGLSYDPTRGGMAAFDHVTDILAAPVDDPEAPFAPIDARMPGPRRHFAAAVHDGQLYLFGGMRDGFELVEDCFRFDFETQSFDPVACPRRARLGGELVALDGRLYLAGGSVRTDDGMQTEPSVEVFDPATGAWSVLLEALPFDVKHLRMQRHGERLLMWTTHHEADQILLAWLDPA